MQQVCICASTKPSFSVISNLLAFNKVKNCDTTTIIKRKVGIHISETHHCDGRYPGPAAGLPPDPPFDERIRTSQYPEELSKHGIVL